jgi:hypothetical protein
VLRRIAGEDYRSAIEQGTASASLVGTTENRLARTHPRLAAAPPAAVSERG